MIESNYAPKHAGPYRQETLAATGYGPPDGRHRKALRGSTIPFQRGPELVKHLAPYTKIAARRDYSEAIYIGGGRHRADA